jgi:hypothetical protein
MGADRPPRRFGFKWRSGVSELGRCIFILGKLDMSKGQCAFRPAVLTRAIKAAEKAGKNVVGAEIDSVSNKIELRFHECGSTATQGEGNEWDRI